MCQKKNIGESTEMCMSKNLKCDFKCINKLNVSLKMYHETMCVKNYNM